MTKEYVEERNGGLYVAGTRISLDSIVYSFRRGESPETIQQNFERLNLEEVYGAITYYLGNQDSVDAYLLKQQADAVALREKNEPDHKAWKQNLLRRREALHPAQPA